VTVCWLWISIAACNFLCPWILGICLQHVHCTFIYLCYIPYGIWVIYGFIQWAKESGKATRCCERSAHDEEAHPHPHPPPQTITVSQARRMPPKAPVVQFLGQGQPKKSPSTAGSLQTPLRPSLTNPNKGTGGQPQAKKSVRI